MLPSSSERLKTFTNADTETSIVAKISNLVLYIISLPTELIIIVEYALEGTIQTTVQLETHLTTKKKEAASS